MWDHDGVHKLFWPCALNFEGLLVFEGFGGESADDSYWHGSLHIVRETRPYGDSPELVAHMSTAVAVRDAGWQRTTELELERELMDSSLERAAMAFFTFEKRPLVVAYGVPL